MRLFKILTIIFVIAAVLGLSITRAARHWLESSITNRIGDALSVDFEVESLEIGIIGGKLALHEVKLKNPIGYTEEYMVTAEDVYVNINLLSLLSGRLGIDSIVVDEPSLAIEKATALPMP